MQKVSAAFVRGISKVDQIPEDGLPHVAFIGRSNVGKSSTINALTGQKILARVSNTPGRTQEINLFLVNNKWYLVDLPGYGYARASVAKQAQISDLVGEYLFETPRDGHTVVLIIDGYVGPTQDDLGMLFALESAGKRIIVAINKIDRIKPSKLHAHIAEVKAKIGPHTTVLYSAETKKGVGELLAAILA